MELRGKSILVLGLGESGLAMARWCVRQGATVRVADTRTAPPCLAALAQQVPGAEFFAGEFTKDLLSGVDALALSPGLSGGLMVVLHARAQGIPVLGEIELFTQALRQLGWRDQCRLVAITGTNGKTTTTALTESLARSAGKPAVAAGNISPSALTALMRCLDAGQLPAVWVLELSSFQLETTETLDADAAVVLNVSDDHLDRYDSVAEYAGAKARVFQGRGVQVLNRQDGRVKAMACPDRALITFGLDAPADERDFGLRDNHGEPWLVQGDRFLLPARELGLAGLHNAANALAALALLQAIDIDCATLVPGLRAFRGLPHRVEKIAHFRGVDYYDDSKGTNVGAVVAALLGLGGQLAASGPDGHQHARKIILIAGGDGKGQDFSPLAPAVAHAARGVVLIGRDGPAIGAALAGTGVTCQQASDMKDAVGRSAALARAGDAVLLSPACASFDMFRNYEHRAQVFAACVDELAEASS